MSDTVLITHAEYVKGQQHFEACDDVRPIAVTGDEQSLAQAVRKHGCRAVIVGMQPLCGPLYETLAEVGGQRGAIITRFGVGRDNVDMNLTSRNRLIGTCARFPTCCSLRTSVPILFKPTRQWPERRWQMW